MEASLSGEPIDATNTEVSAVAVETHSDEDITAGAKVSKINESSNEIEIDLEEERKTGKLKWHWTLTLKILSKL